MNAILITIAIMCNTPIKGAHQKCVLKTSECFIKKFQKTPKLGHLHRMKLLNQCIKENSR